MPYANIPGFDVDKLSGAKPYDSPLKYSDSVRNFSQFLGGGGQISRNNLGGAVDYAKQHGFGNAQAIGDDKIDYGDGRGAIDVIRSNGELWFNNMPGQPPQPSAQQPPMNMDAIRRVLQAFMSGSGDLLQPQPVGPPAVGEQVPSGNPYMTWLNQERGNQTNPQMGTPQVDQNQMVEQALMRAWLGD